MPLCSPQKGAQPRSGLRRDSNGTRLSFVQRRIPYGSGSIGVRSFCYYDLRNISVGEGSDGHRNTE